MIKETFRRIEYSDETKFLKTNDKIELKRYSDDLIFLANYNSTLDAQFTSGEETPITIGSPVISDFDSFGLSQHLDLKGSVIYGYDTFTNLNEEGHISFRLSSGFDNNYGEQTFLNENPSVVISDGTDYFFKLYLGDVLQGEFSIELNIGATKVDVFNALSIEIATYANVLYNSENKIKIISLILGQSIYITEPDSGNSLLTLMNGVSNPIIQNAPTQDIEFFKLAPSGNLNNAILLTHDINSHIIINMYDSSGNLIVDEDAGIWSNESIKYYEFELSWNENIGQLFIEGKLKHLFLTNFSRVNSLTELTLQGIDSIDYHKIDEVILKNTFGHNKNYIPAILPLTPYNTENPYIDIYFGKGFKENEITDLIINTSNSGINFIVKIGHTWYYYFSGAWRASDGTFSQSTSADVFETQFAELFFNENYDLDIRVFFHTDGYENVWIDEFSIIIEKGSSAAAYITGTIAITGTVDLSINNSVEITTDQGSLIVDLSSAAVDASLTTLQEIKQAINDANVPGLAAATDDGNYHLVLLSSNTGSGSIVAIDHADTDDALSIVWDAEGATDLGEDTEIVSEFSDFSELYRFIRAKLGAPLVPVELTDEQLDDCISSAVYHFNKWRNFQESIETTTLTGSPATGYELPAIVGGEENITEIILSPRYPTSYYNGRDELMSNIYIQSIYDNKSVMSNAADYHIALVATKDLNMVLNTEVRWEYLNKKIFLYPTPPPSLRIGIKYKSSMTLSEIINSQSIKDFALAEAKITLGTIRSTFGGAIPSGDGMLQLNGSELKAEGTQEKADLKATWKSSTAPYEMLIG